jgi:energy-coupling factor transporter ATP-binding protein EcfA2
LVFTSSSIRGLESLRAEIKREVEALDLADAWLFEFHAVAAGAAPSAQYLQKARDCDVFVLIVGDEVRQGTAQEYEVARGDNPRKILPFLLAGDPGSTSDFRQQLRDQHATRTCAETQLPGEISAAIREFVTTGEIFRTSLVERIQTRHAALRQISGISADLRFERVLAVGDAEFSATDLLEPGRRIVLTGPAGSGKSDFALTALGAVDERLPLFIRMTSQRRSIHEAIEAEFAAVRFNPGRSLVEQYLRDGRLALVIDGLDEMGPRQRARLLEAIDPAIEEHPRTATVVLARAAPVRLERGWLTGALKPLDDAQLDTLFQGHGYPANGWMPLSRRISELIRLPFWAALLARYGREATNASELLAYLVRQRIQHALPGDEINQIRIREVLGTMALQLRPEVDTNLAAALDEVARTQRLTSAQARFAPMPAETILDHAVSTGLVVRAGDELRFAHPLISAYLAAVTASTDPNTNIPSGDADLVSFAAIELGDRDPERMVNYLRATSIVVLAQTLRMAGMTSRESDLEIDVRRYDAAAREFLPLALTGTRKFDKEVTRALVTNGHLCLMQARGTEPAIEYERDVRAWADVGEEPVRYTCWPSSPFADQLPEFVAAGEALASLKQAWTDMDPGGSRFAPMGSRAGQVMRDPANFRDRLLQHVRSVREARNTFLAALPPLPELAASDDEPHVIVRRGASDARFTVTWGQPAPIVEVFEEESEYEGHSVTELLADPAAIAYAEITDWLETRVGSSMRSGASKAPTPFAWDL